MFSTNSIKSKKAAQFYFIKINIENAEWISELTCRSGSQHTSVVDSHWAVGAAHGQIVWHQWRDGYRGRCPPTVNQDVLESKKTQWDEL